MAQTYDPTATIPPADLPPSRASAPPRRRWLWGLGAVAFLVVAALVAGAAYVLSLQPLGPGDGGYGMDTDGSARKQVLTNSFGADYRIIAPKPGDTIALSFALNNSGPLSVTIDDITQPFSPQAKVGELPMPRATTPGRLALGAGLARSDLHAAPFTLAPGGSAQVQLSFTVLSCATVTGDALIRSVTTLPVRYRVLGISHTEQVRLGVAFSIQSLPFCP